MALQYSGAVRDAQLDAFESTTGASAVLTILTGTVPANCAAADTGTLLVTMTLPADWMAAASGGTKAKAGTWQDTSADGTGTAGYFRIKSAGAVCHAQGTITTTAVGTGDMLLDNTSIATGQSVTINTFTLTAGNA